VPLKSSAQSQCAVMSISERTPHGAAPLRPPETAIGQAASSKARPAQPSPCPAAIGSGSARHRRRKDGRRGGRRHRRKREEEQQEKGARGIVGRAKACEGGGREGGEAARDPQRCTSRRGGSRPSCRSFPRSRSSLPAHRSPPVCPRARGAGQAPPARPLLRESAPDPPPPPPPSHTRKLDRARRQRERESGGRRGATAAKAAGGEA
jgi:hypothetical protein